MATGFLRGALAGAAGTTALNATTYLDMAVRGRGSSSTPQQVVEESAERAGVEIPGDEQTRQNRLQGLGPLSGTAVGVAVGAAAGLVQQLLLRRGHRLPALIAVPMLGAAAMAMSDVPMKVLGISDPAEWAAKDWASDAVPHLVYGAVTYAGLRSAAA
jgi:hypothetical protein